MITRWNGECFIAVSIVLLVFYLCLPISMAFMTSVAIRILVVLATASFLIGIIMLQRWRYLVVIIILFAFMFLYWRITWSIKLDGFYYVYYCFAGLVFVFSGLILYKSNNRDLINRLFIYITIVFVVTAVTSIIGLSIYPLAARELGRPTSYNNMDASTYTTLYRTMNIAGWGQVYGLLFGIPATFMVWKNTKKPTFLVFCILLLIMLALSQLTYGVLLAVAFLIISLIINVKKKSMIVVLLAVFIAVLVILANLNSILTYVVKLYDNAGLGFLSTKLSDFKTLIINQTAVGDASARVGLYSRSIHTFINNPLFGLIFYGKADPSLISFHSEFLDILGALGLVGLIIVAVSVFHYFRFLVTLKNNTTKMLVLILIGFIVLFIINPVFHSPQIFAGAFLYPLLASRYCCLKEENQLNYKQYE